MLSQDPASRAANANETEKYQLAPPHPGAGGGFQITPIPKQK